jgi:hypothetical protein
LSQKIARIAEIEKSDLPRTDANLAAGYHSFFYRWLSFARITGENFRWRNSANVHALFA